MSSTDLTLDIELELPDHRSLAAAGASFAGRLLAGGAFDIAFLFTLFISGLSL